MKSRTTYAVGLLAIPVLIPILFILVIGGQSLSSSAAACSPTSTAAPVVAPEDAAAELGAEQIGIAQQIVAAVQSFPATTDKPHAAVVALATAVQESRLRNLDYGDRDSLGVFQQRPSQGWGTPEEVMNVAHATTSFLEHLVLVPDWETRPVTDVAADVQRPAEEYRGLYAQWVPMATTLVEQIWGTSVSLLPTPNACGEANVMNPQPGPEDAGGMDRAQSWVDEEVPYSQTSYHTNQYGTYRQDCSGYVSLVWGLARSYTTYTLPSIAHPITKDELRAGDIMLRPGHTLIFEKWTNADRTSYWAYEQQRPGRLATHYVVPYPYWPGNGEFVPYRKTGVPSSPNGRL